MQWYFVKNVRILFYPDKTLATSLHSGYSHDKPMLATDGQPAANKS